MLSITGPSPSGVCTSAKPPSTEPWGGGSSRPPDISSMSFQVRVCMVSKNALKSLGCCWVDEPSYDWYAFLSVSSIWQWMARCIFHWEWLRVLHFCVGNLVHWSPWTFYGQCIQFCHHMRHQTSKPTHDTPLAGQLSSLVAAPFSSLMHSHASLFITHQLRIQLYHSLHLRTVSDSNVWSHWEANIGTSLF